MFLRAGFFAILVLIFLTAFAQCNQNSPVVIPAKDIWGWAMLGNKSVRELEPEVFGPEMQTIPEQEQQKRSRDSRVLTIHTHCSTPDEKGFAVEGTGKIALKNIYAVIAQGQSPTTSFSSNNDISLFFYSKAFGAYVRVDHVEIEGNSIKIFYRYVTHFEKELTWHFALIPVGKLPTGKFDVTMIQLPIDMTLMHGGYGEIDKKVGDQYVCKPFSFSVGKTEIKGDGP